MAAEAEVRGTARLRPGPVSCLARLSTFRGGTEGAKTLQLSLGSRDPQITSQRNTQEDVEWPSAWDAGKADAAGQKAEHVTSSFQACPQVPHNSPPRMGHQVAQDLGPKWGEKRR